MVVLPDRCGQPDSKPSIHCEHTDSASSANDNSLYHGPICGGVETKARQPKVQSETGVPVMQNVKTMPVAAAAHGPHLQLSQHTIDDLVTVLVVTPKMSRTCCHPQRFIALFHPIDL